MSTIKFPNESSFERYTNLTENLFKYLNLPISNMEHVERKGLTVRFVQLCAFFFFFAPAKRIPAAKQEAAEGTVGNPNLVQIL